jgi:hypothetical protein
MNRVIMLITLRGEICLNLSIVVLSASSIKLEGFASTAYLQ